MTPGALESPIVINRYSLSLDAAGIRRLVRRTIDRELALDLKIRLKPGSARATLEACSIKTLDGLEAPSLSELLRNIALYLDGERPGPGPEKLENAPKRVGINSL